MNKYKFIGVALIFAILSACGDSNEITLYSCSCGENLVDQQCQTVESCISNTYRLDLIRNEAIPKSTPQFAFQECQIFDKNNWFCKRDHQTIRVSNGIETIDQENYVLYKNKVRSVSFVEYWISKISSLTGIS